MPHRKITSNIVSLLSSDVLSQVLRLLRGFILARFLGPELMGVWATLFIYLMYGENLHLGIYNALTREIPVSVGKKDNKNVQSFINHAFSYTVCSSIVVFIIMLCVNMFSSYSDENYVLGLRFLIIMIIVQQWTTMYKYLLLATNNFKIFSFCQQVSSVLGFFSILLVIPFSFVGQMWGLLLADIVYIVLLVYHTKMRFSFELEKSKFLHLFSIGFPIFVVGLTFTVLMSVNRFLIVHYLSKKELGYFSLAFMIFNIVYLIPESIRRVLYIRMGEVYGQVGESISSLERYVTLSSKMLSIIMPPVVFALSVSLYIGIPLILPKYSPGVIPVVLYIIGILFFALSSIYINLFNITSNQKRLLLAQICTIVLNSGLGILLMRNGYGLMGVAISSLFSYGIYFLIMSFNAQSILGKNYLEIVWSTISLLWPLVILIGIIVVCYWTAVLCAGLISYMQWVLIFLVSSIVYSVVFLIIYKDAFQNGKLNMTILCEKLLFGVGQKTSSV